MKSWYEVQQERDTQSRHQQTPHYCILDENPYQYQVQRTGKVHCTLNAGIKVRMLPELALRHWHFWMKARSQLESCMLQSKVWYGNKIIFVLLSSSVGNKSMEWKGRQKLKCSVLFTEWPHAFFYCSKNIPLLMCWQHNTVKLENLPFHLKSLFQM